MRESSHLRAADLRKLRTLQCEVADLGLDAAAALEHLLAGIRAYCETPILWLAVSKPPGEAGLPTAENPTPELQASRMDGLDPKRFMACVDWFIEQRGYQSHPFLRRLRTGTVAQAYLRRQLISDTDWYAGEFVSGFLRSQDFDDTLAAMHKLPDGREIWLGLARPWGDRPFTLRQANWLTALQGAAHWCLRVYAEEVRRTALTPLEQRVAQLPAYLVKVLQFALTGRSEKEIAVALDLKPRTVHKYLELIYRRMEVGSRAELMSLFVSPPPPLSPESS